MQEIFTSQVRFAALIQKLPATGRVKNRKIHYNRVRLICKEVTMKKTISLLLAVLLLVSLGACGGAKIDPNDPNQGLWTATTGEMFGVTINVKDFFGEGFTIELQSKGKCVLTVDGSTAKGTWTLNNGAFTVEGGGIDCAGRLENGKLTLDDVMGMGIALVFEKEGGSSDAAPSVSDSSGKNLNEKLEWWDGDWYGYWTVVSADDPYLHLKGGVWDCYATIDVREDDTATVSWWDDDVFLGEVEIALSFEGYQVEIGLADSTGGMLFDAPVQDGAWYLTPDNSDYENMIQIDEWFDDSDGDSFRYQVFLRPWGMLWDDVPEDNRSPDYDSWYLGMRHLTMLEALGGESSAPAPEPTPDGGTSDGPTTNSGAGATDVSLQLVDFTLSLTLPSGDWFDEGITGGASGGVTTAHFYYKETHANAPRVDISESFTMSTFDSYKNYWENYEDIGSKTIGGIEMEGRTYKSFGMQWIDYIAKIGDEQYLGVTIIDLDPDSGETKALLDSITFR